LSARVVRATEINRILDVLAARGVNPAAFTVLPGGAVRFHMAEPAANDRSPDLEAEGRAWDEALGG
jgi:hypothetical protein